MKMHTCVRRGLLVGAVLVLAPMVVFGQFGSSGQFGSMDPPGSSSDSMDGLGSQSRFGMSPAMQDFSLSGQDSDSDDADAPSAGSALTVSDAVRIRRAMSDPRYPATPGDVYRLSFTQTTQTETLFLYVSPSYQVNMDFLGSVDAKGMTFQELRDRIQEIMEESYPGSSMRLTIEQVGEFPVYVRGEVTQAQELYVWGLTRLSSLPPSLFTEAASFRNIAVEGREGERRVYDLFRARRFGDRAQDPLLEPGDTVVIPRFTRRVAIAGNVHRPGTYDLLEDESYEALLEFGGGYKETADREAIRLSRFVREAEAEGRPQQATYLSDGELRETTLQHLDAVDVADRLRTQAVFFIEGAVRPDVAETEATSAAQNGFAAGADRVSEHIVPGQRLSEYVHSIEAKLLQDADLAGAYIRRDMELIAVDLLALLQGQLSLTADPMLQAGDVLVVPFRQLRVTVLGAVNSPGRYPYVPDRGWRYYVDLAGGFSEDLNDFGTVRIRDGDDQEVDRDASVGPEYTIVARRDSPRYWLLRSLNVATTTMNFTNALLNLLETFGLADPGSVFGSE